MGKGSGDCDRPGISLGASGAKTELNLGADVASVSEIDTTLELRRTEHYWFTKDGQATFQKRKEGWVVFSISDPICEAFREYGVISSIDYNPAYFPSLKAARQAVTDVSLEAGLNIDSRLTRGDFVSYKIKDLPLSIMKEEGQWWVASHLLVLSSSLKKHFNSTQEFKAAWKSTDVALAYYPTRKSAHQAVINWLAQTIAEEE